MDMKLRYGVAVRFSVPVSESNQALSENNGAFEFTLV